MAGLIEDEKKGTVMDTGYQIFKGTLARFPRASGASIRATNLPHLG